MENRSEQIEYRPSLTYCHASPRNNGSMVRFELHPAHGRVEGSIFVSIAAQKTVSGCENGVQIYPTFDWRNKIVVCLKMEDLSQMLEVFRGCTESLAEGKGLFHRSESANTIIRLEHRIDPSSGYYFELSRKRLDGALTRAGIFFSTSEAMGLCTALEGALHYVAFGIPKVYPRVARGGSPAVSAPAAATAAAAGGEEDLF